MSSSRQAALSYKWIDSSSILCRITALPQQTTSIKYIGFDVDGTVIRPKSGRVFPKDEHDWKFCYESVKPAICKLHGQGYNILFISNQLGVSKGKITKDVIMKKMDAVIDSFDGIPIDFICATEENIYRKPDIGAWTFIQDLRLQEMNTQDTASDNNDNSVTLECYIGDAAGRPKAIGRRADFSDSDLMFARNVGCEFRTPEQFFQGVRG